MKSYWVEIALLDMQKHVHKALHHSKLVTKKGKHLFLSFIRRHPRATFALIGVALINVFFLTQLYKAIRVTEVRKQIDTWLTTPYHIKVKDRTYTYSYRDLGITIDKDAAVEQWRAHGILVPHLIFTQQFQQFVQDTVFNFGETEDSDERYRIDEQKFRKLLIERLGLSTIPLYPKLTKVRDEQQETIANVEQKIFETFNQPLTVYANAGGVVHTIFLTEETLKAITTILLTADGRDVTITVDEGQLNSALITALRKQGFILKGAVANPKIAEDYMAAIHSRFNGNTQDALSLALDQGPNTTGKQAKKYIEVDISQQMMYLWRDGKLLKSYRVSTGLDYPTPVGTFTIINKTGLGFSNIYQTWLPWWMGFAYSKELGAYFGIHEQPYSLDASGKQIRQADFIGKPNTGGCVALAPGAAAEVYRFGDIGTPLYIFE